ncbi:hypothetical protein E2C01_077429 [Portunus trituberculatus]|uniref:Uncharacterized protein n=1 Tax=Portunus trituberculatus TaxID=210409 RepID=A0A5B7IM37_PORTR|nr:hypothetical protein [Portunus trituberculatus]
MKLKEDSVLPLLVSSPPLQHSPYPPSTSLPPFLAVLTKACVSRRRFRHLVLVWEEEWTTLKELYRPDHVVTAFYNEVGSLMTDPGVSPFYCLT